MTMVYVSLVTTLLASSVALGLIAWNAWREKLPRNEYVGIRTPQTMADDETWRRVNKASAPSMLAVSVVLLLEAAAVAIFWAIDAPMALTAATAIVAIVVVLVVLLRQLHHARAGRR
jgi:uncharacterized membrane protein